MNQLIPKAKDASGAGTDQDPGLAGIEFSVPAPANS